MKSSLGAAKLMQSANKVALPQTNVGSWPLLVTESRACFPCCCLHDVFHKESNHVALGVATKIRAQFTLWFKVWRATVLLMTQWFPPQVALGAPRVVLQVPLHYTGVVSQPSSDPYCRIPLLQWCFGIMHCYWTKISWWLRLLGVKSGMAWDWSSSPLVATSTFIRRSIIV